MEIVMRKVSELTPYGLNAKKHDDTQVANVANSIKRFGWQQPIVIDEQGVVVIGHCRLMAAKKLGLKEVPVTVASGLTEDEIKELRIADNKSNESPWEMNLLAEDIEGLDFDGFDFDFGFKDDAEDEEEPEIAFTEELREEHNYVVLFFDNDVDWLQAQSLLDITPKQAFSTRKDGKITKTSRKIGIGRVLNGAKALERILGHENIG